MCGITGIFGKNAKESDLEAMLQIASKRGPEESRSARTSNGLIGQTKLGFVAEGKNPQPLIEDNATFAFNGEIYNWQELNSRYHLGAQTDTEVLMRGLRTKGQEFLSEIDGQFAYILDDGEKVSIGRDKWGISPLVFGQNKNGETVVASTPEALSAANVPTENYRTLPSGTCATINSNGVKLSPWFTLPQVDTTEQKNANIEGLRKKCIQSVEARIPDKPEILYTAMGGMDSQFITATIARKTRGQFGGAITVVPWDPKNPSDTTGGDHRGARATIEMLATEGIPVKHHIIQMTPEYVNSSIDKLMDVLGPDYFNVCCGLTEDLVATTTKKLGGKAIMTAGGPDEAGRSYKPINREHKDRMEEGWHAICDQFASSEGVRAGLVFGEHGLENRVPLAFLIEESQYIKPEDKLEVYDWAEGQSPLAIKQKEKLFFREIVRPLIPEIMQTIPKDTVHGASGTKPILKHLADNDPEWQKDKPAFFKQMEKTGWEWYTISYGDNSPFGNGPAYCLWRWAKTHNEEFERGPYLRYGATRKDFFYSPDLKDKTPRPICHEQLFAPRRK